MERATITKKELLEMVAHLNDDDVVKFVVERQDRDGFPEDVFADVYKVIGPNYQRVYGEYQIARYEEIK